MSFWTAARERPLLNFRVRLTMRMVQWQLAQSGLSSRRDLIPMTEYDGYRIEPFEPTPGRWRARISRLDGKALKTGVPPTEQPFLDTMDTESYGLAVELAKRAIDGGGID